MALAGLSPEAIDAGMRRASQAAYRALSFVRGYRSDVSFSTSIIQPSATGLRCDEAHIGRQLGLRRLSARGPITNNVIIGNGSGIGGFARSKVKIENNIIADSSYAGIGMHKSCSLRIQDNIFAFCKLINNQKYQEILKPDQIYDLFPVPGTYFHSSNTIGLRGYLYQVAIMSSPSRP